METGTRVTSSAFGRKPTAKFTKTRKCKARFISSSEWFSALTSPTDCWHVPSKRCSGDLETTRGGETRQALTTGMLAGKRSQKERRRACCRSLGGRGGGRTSPAGKALVDDRKIRDIHDQILNKNVGNSLIANWMQPEENIRLFRLENWGRRSRNSSMGFYKIMFIQPGNCGAEMISVFEYWDHENEDRGRRGRPVDQLTFEIDHNGTDDRSPTPLLPGLGAHTSLEAKESGGHGNAAGIIQKYLEPSPSHRMDRDAAKNLLAPLSAGIPPRRQGRLQPHLPLLSAFPSGGAPGRSWPQSRVAPPRRLRPPQRSPRPGKPGAGRPACRASAFDADLAGGGTGGLPPGQ